MSIVGKGDGERRGGSVGISGWTFVLCLDKTRIAVCESVHDRYALVTSTYIA